MLSPAQLIIHADAQIGMACCNFKWSTVHFINHQQWIPFMCNMHDIALINAKLKHLVVCVDVPVYAYPTKLAN